MTLREVQNEPTPGVTFQWPVRKIEPKPQPEKFSVREVAIEAYIESSGDPEASAALFLKRLRKDHRDFYTKKAEDSMRLWAQDQIKHARRGMRETLAFYPQGQMTTPNQPLTEASLRSVSLVWFDWPVLPGVMLRDATKADLEKASAAYMAQATTHTKRAAWLRAVAESLPDDATKVSAALTEDAVAQLASTHGVATS